MALSEPKLRLEAYLAGFRGAFRNTLRFMELLPLTVLAELIV